MNGVKAYVEDGGRLILGISPKYDNGYPKSVEISFGLGIYGSYTKKVNAFQGNVCQMVVGKQNPVFAGWREWHQY
jgi:hypothetical protein